MIQRLIFNAPVSALSIGQVSFNVLRELYRRKIQVAYFPIGGVDFSAYRLDPQFGAWIEQAVNNRYQRLDRKVPTLRIWHIRDSEMRLSDCQALLSWHETDSPQPAEVSVVNHQDHTFFTSSWSVDNFKTFGANNVSFVPLGLDPDFTPPSQRSLSPDITHWVCVGKWEELRKMTGTKIAAWIKRYGGKRNHQLTLCVDNPFYRRETCGFTTEDLMNQTFANAGGKPFNVNVLPRLKTNAEMLQLYQSADLDISSIARAEGWNIPGHTVTCFGKWSVVTNVTAHKDWATPDNAILIEPSGMVKAADNVFFREGDQFNAGNMYDFTMDSIVDGFERAEKKAKIPNEAGLAMGRSMTYAKTVDQILSVLE